MKRILVLLIVFAASLFAGEGKHPWQVEINGNKAFSTFQLEEQLDIPEGFGQMDTTKQDFLMRLSMENIRALYYSRGYHSLDIFLDIRRQYVGQDSVRTNYVIDIRDGKRYRFSGVKLNIPEDSKIDIDKSDLSITKKRFYNREDISDDLQTIQQTFRKEGYLHAELNYAEIIDTTKKTIFVEINVTPKARVMMGNMISQAQRTPSNKLSEEQNKEAGLTDTAWLSSLWKIPKGETIDGDQYNSFKSKLFSTQLFTQIKLTDSLREDGLSDIYMTVKERVPGELRFGFFFEQLYGFGAMVSTRHKNFFGKFHEFYGNFLLAQHKQELSLGYANPLLFGTSFSFIPTAIRFEDRLTFNHEKITPPAYPDSTEERYEVIDRADLTFGLSQHIRFRGTLDARYVNKMAEQMFKLKGEIALSFDYTNDYFNPTKGIRLAPTVGAGTNWGGTEWSNMAIFGDPYTYGEVTGNIYIPLFWTLNGAFSGSAGRFFSKASEDDARVFYQGGTRSVRGYRFRSIYAGYTSTTTNEKNEEEEVINTGLTPTYIRFNEEIRWNLPWKSLQKWQLVQFYDWAKVMDDNPKYKTVTKESLGLGVRYQWQFLTFRLDYAFKKNLTDWSPEGFAWGRFAFDLSQTF
ncbi:MAG: BamA/TamA family outer membrane protein [Fibrobacter sp.]|nr:BamA/TamA family outer membrane protein [Fibrobacter sp.]